MDKKEFIHNVIWRLSNISVGASALRNQGAPGIVEAARVYFREEIELAKLFKALSSNKRYKKFLDTHTSNLLKTFPSKGKSWGAARKGLNLYFREVVYNKFISDYYGLPKNMNKYNIAIAFLEVPLDRDVATGIRRDAGEELPKWKSIRDLDKRISDVYQNAAMAIAKEEGVARIHLDLKYWRQKQLV